MSTSPPPAPEQESPREDGPRVGAADLRSLDRLRRSRTDRQVAGVAGGLGRYLDVDPTIIRVAFVVLTLFGGAGVVLYGAAWLLVPDEGTDRASIDLTPVVRTVVLVGVAAFSFVALFGHTWGFFRFPWPLALVSLIAVAALAGRSRGSRRVPRTWGPPPGWVGPPAGPPTGAPVSLTKDGGPTGDPTSGAGGPHTWTPPSYDAAYSAPHPAPRRRPGPRLFLPTLALIALGWGVLRLVQLGGHGVPVAAYAALALAVCGLVLVVGAWVGRVGGVVLLALLSLVALGASRVSDGGVGDRVDASPTSSVALGDGYTMDVGRMTIDLTRISDLTALDGRTVDLDGDVGRITVLVPEGLDVTASADADAGRLDVFGRTAHGSNVTVTAGSNGATGVPHLTIHATIDVGDITVRND